MTDIFFEDPDDVPLPPEEINIRELEVEPYPDGRRIAVRFYVSPFQKSPNYEISIFNEEGKQVSELSVVEAIENRMTFTLHLRESDPIGRYKVSMRVFYTDLDGYEKSDSETASAKKILADTGQTIDRKEVSFELIK